jgi:hypothetical protein
MTTSLPFRLFLVVVLLIQTIRPVASAVCHICGEAGNDLLAFPNVVLEGVGKTCADISIQVASAVPFGSADCASQQGLYYARCCTPGVRPAGGDIATGTAVAQQIPAVSYVGPNPVCNVCRDGDFPYATSMVINFLYIGVGTCTQYWMMGQQGLIPTHMCSPVQFFSYEPCGCGEFNPYFNANHPLNQQAQQAPATTTTAPQDGRTDTSSGIPQIRTPVVENKTGLSVASQRGGAAGNGNRRGLKGTKVISLIKDVSVVDDV